MLAFFVRSPWRRPALAAATAAATAATAAVCMRIEEDTKLDCMRRAI